MISFIVVAHENPSPLRTCLSSLLDQTTTEEEEIIVVDNSVGNTWTSLNRDLCQMSDRIRYEWVAASTEVDKENIRHKRCLYTATEIGAELATGDWLCFPNQDSIYAPVFCERMLAAANKNAWDLVYCDFVLGGPTHKYFPVNVAPHVCAIDKTSFIVKREWFKGFQAKWTNYEIADGLFIEDLVKGGIRHGRVDELLVLHN